MTSLVYTLESKPKSQWGLYGSYVMASSSLGSLLGFFMRTLMSRKDLVAWGWRLPFLAGIVVAFSAYYLKFHCEEIEPEPEAKRTNPIKEAFKPENRTALLASALVPMLWASGFYVTFVWMAIYMEELCDNPPGFVVRTPTFPRRADARPQSFLEEGRSCTRPSRSESLLRESILKISPRRDRDRSACTGSMRRLAADLSPGAGGPN